VISIPALAPLKAGGGFDCGENDPVMVLNKLY